MRPRAKDIAQAHDDAAIARAQVFVVSWFLGRGPDSYGKPISRADLWDRAEFSVEDYGSREMALSAARFARDERGRDEVGREGMIYAICPNGLSLFMR